MSISRHRAFSVLWFVLALLFVFSASASHDQRQQIAAQSSQRTATSLPPVISNADWTPVVQSFDGVDMVQVPAGCFMMGSTEAQIDAAFQQCEANYGSGNCRREWFEAEQPAQQVCFDQPFWIDRTEVSNAQFARFGGRAARASNWTNVDRPREQVTWTEARDFCAKRGAHLPTEAEWEYAARGPDELISPWGNRFDGSRLNSCDSSCVYDWVHTTTDDGYGNTAPAGSYPEGASWVDALDLSGNVGEWTSSLYAPYPYNAEDGRETGSGDRSEVQRVVRGGSWHNYEENLRAANRDWLAPDIRNFIVGFRCARSSESAAHVAAEAATVTPTMVTTNDRWTPVIRSFDGVDMVLVPAGCFMMGSTEEEVDAAFRQCEADVGIGICSRDWFSDEQPVYQVCFDQPFWIDRYEVSNGQFAQFDGVAEHESRWTESYRPREQITWFEARDFCAKRGARLPNEAEWEYAARGPSNLVYPWGDTFVADNAVYSGNSDETATVGSKPGGASWVGALDMSGSVWEWANSLYEPYPYQAGDGLEGETDDRRNVARVLRAGSWDNVPNNLRAANRLGIDPDNWVIIVGFRCARSSESAAQVAAEAASVTPTMVTANDQWTPVIQLFDGVDMVLVPPGCFMMGSNDGNDDEKPVHQVCFDAPFWIDRTEVTNEQFAQFGGVAFRESSWSDADRPRGRITWFEARDFCAARGARLPTEAEWEYAARGPDGLAYPWGNAFDGTLVNHCDSNCEFEWKDSTADDGNQYTAPTGGYPEGASWVGALDLSGNVWEWTSSLYEAYPYNAGNEREADTGDSADVLRVLRGGSWSNNQFILRAAFRFGYSPVYWYVTFGIRCARSSE